MLARVRCDYERAAHIKNSRSISRVEEHDLASVLLPRLPATGQAAISEQPNRLATPNGQNECHENIPMPERRAGLLMILPTPTGAMNRDPRYTLSRELEAKQSLLDQLRALAADLRHRHAAAIATQSPRAGAVCPVLNARSNNRRMAFYHAISDWATCEGR
jgi:hypothetical protein